MNDIVKDGEISIKRMLNKARSDIALADPVGWLIRVATTGQLDGEPVGARDRIAIMMKMAEKLVPNADERLIDDDKKKSLPPLQIILNGGNVNAGGILKGVIDVTHENEEKVLKMVDDMEGN